MQAEGAWSAAAEVMIGGEFWVEHFEVVVEVFDDSGVVAGLDGVDEFFTFCEVFAAARKVNVAEGLGGFVEEFL